MFLLAFAVGVSAVRFAAACIEAIYPLEEISVASASEYSLDEYALENVLTEYVDINVRGVRVGTTEKEMLALLGKPKKAENYKGDSNSPSSGTFNYAGLIVETIEFEDGKRKVISLSVESDAWNVNGVTVGSDVLEVEKIFGRPRSGTDDSLMYLDASDLDVDFAIENGKVVGIHVLYGC